MSVITYTQSIPVRSLNSGTNAKRRVAKQSERYRTIACIYSTILDVVLLENTDMSVFLFIVAFFAGWKAARLIKPCYQKCKAIIAIEGKKKAIVCRGNMAPDDHGDLVCVDCFTKRRVGLTR